MALQNTQQFVIVDDTDPSIIYSPAEHWTLLTVNVSNPADFVVPPQYGTLHRANFENAKFTFTFTGVSIAAVFYGSNTHAIISCTLDGQAMQVNLDGIRQDSVLCINNQTIPGGSHEFVVKVNSDIAATLLFDYIKYAPNEGNVTATDVDIEYSFIESVSYVENNTNFTNITDTDPLQTGNALDFFFVGYSLGLYASFFSEVTGVPCPVSYSVDGNTPMNFTISNPTTNVTTDISSMLVFQSPRYSLGQHHFHMDILGDNTTIPLNLDYIIIQNTPTPHVLLDPLPIASSKNSSSSSPNPLSNSTATPQPHINPSVTHIGPIIGGAAAGVIILALIIILTFFACRRRRLSTSLEDEDIQDYPDLVVEPFQQQHNPYQFRSRKSGTNQRHDEPTIQNEEPNLFIEPFHQWHTRFRSFRKNLAHRRRIEPITTETRNVQRDAVASNAHAGHSSSHIAETRNVETNLVTEMDSHRPFRYRIHEDSGEEITQPDEGTVIVDLPPNYTTIEFAAPRDLPENQPVETQITENEDRDDRDVGTE